MLVLWKGNIWMPWSNGPGKLFSNLRENFNLSNNETKRNENKIRFSVAGSCKYRFVDVYVGHRHLHQWINRKGHLDITVSLKEKNEILYFNRNILNYNFPNLINLFHSDDYKNWIEEGIIINALGCVLIALGVLVSFAVRRSNAPATAKVYVTERI